MVTEETASPWPEKTLEAAVGLFFLGGRKRPLGEEKGRNHYGLLA